MQIIDRILFQFYRLYLDSNSDSFGAWLFTILWFSLSMTILFLSLINIFIKIRNDNLDIVNGLFALKIGLVMVIFTSFYVFIRKSAIKIKYNNMSVKSEKIGRAILLISFFAVLAFYIIVLLAFNQ